MQQTKLKVVLTWLFVAVICEVLPLALMYVFAVALRRPNPLPHMVGYSTIPIITLGIMVVTVFDLYLEKTDPGVLTVVFGLVVGILLVGVMALGIAADLPGREANGEKETLVWWFMFVQVLISLGALGFCALAKGASFTRRQQMETERS